MILARYSYRISSSSKRLDRRCWSSNWWESNSERSRNRLRSYLRSLWFMATLSTSMNLGLGRRNCSAGSHAIAPLNCLDRGWTGRVSDGMFRTIAPLFENNDKFRYLEVYRAEPRTIKSLSGYCRNARIAIWSIFAWPRPRFQKQQRQCLSNHVAVAGWAEWLHWFY